jgi:hypothetical protein
MVELAKANPDIETLKLTLWVAASIITLLLLIVSYFLKRQITITEQLTKAVHELTTAVALLNNQSPRMERRLDIHNKRLDDNDKQIARLEATVYK